GTWTLVDGAYVGNAGGEAPEPTCVEGGTAMLTSTRTGMLASNVRVRARLTSITTADKVLVLRGVSTRTRLELNFRANFDDEGSISGGDLVIQSLTDCVRTVHVAPGVVRIPHAATQSIDVEVELVGQDLTVNVDGAPIYSGQPLLAAPLPTGAGSVGFGVLRFGGSARFDNVVIEALE
ncbi:MAG TPA: hypothetical protein VER33_00575, partial [Polyangiaceae bacterium]|nr:hypothetical protein [Polyangiaceae bacterium]